VRGGGSGATIAHDKHLAMFKPGLVQQVYYLLDGLDRKPIQYQMKLRNVTRNSIHHTPLNFAQYAP
jgi:hypothetical protein